MSISGPSTAIRRRESRVSSFMRFLDRVLINFIFENVLATSAVCIVSIRLIFTKADVLGKRCVIDSDDKICIAFSRERSLFAENDSLIYDLNPFHSSTQSSSEDRSRATYIC